MSDKLDIYVGPNASGKSYKLKKVFEENQDISIFINETGIPISVRLATSIRVDFETMSYIYENEVERGTQKRQQPIEIESVLHNLIHFCEKKLTYLRGISKKSEGQKKLNNIYETILNTNLNRIEFFIIDEPENNLDDNYLKEFIELLSLLFNVNIKCIIATHSFRLLEVMEFDFDDIHLLYRNQILYEEKVLSNSEIIDIYNQHVVDINGVITSNSIPMRKKRMIKFSYGVLRLYDYLIDTQLKKSDFLKLLFYNEVFIFEGESELIALKSIVKYNASVMNSIITNGKDTILLYVRLLQYLNKRVVVIMDSDNSTNGSFSQILNVLLNDGNDLRVIKLSDDFEDKFNIDLETHRNFIASQVVGDGKIEKNNIKCIASYIDFKEPTRQLALKDLLDEAVDYNWS